MTTASSAIHDRIAILRNEVEGRVIEPGDQDYDATRAIVAGGVDLRPAAIVQVAGVEDIRRVLAAARETGAELAVRSGGHSGAGFGSTDGGLVIDLRSLKAIEIDPAAKTAWAETGLTAAEVSGALAAHGLAVGFGDTGSVGIGGITSGGGIGYLVRRWGLTIDNVLAADVVTADGQLLRADGQTNPDLFWAVLGGAGNVGIATRFQYQLHDLPGIVGGMLFLPVTAEILQRFVELADEAPEAMSTIANAMPCPPMPMVDEAWHGRLVIFGLMCFAGDAESGEAAFRPFRELSKLAGLDAPIADLVRPMTYPEMFPPDDPDYHPLAISRNLLIDRLDRATAELIMRGLEASDASMRVAQIRVMGGAMARIPNDATAFAHRDRLIMINVAAFYEGEDDRARRQAWVAELTDAIRSSAGATDRGAYVNFVNDEGPQRIHDIYPGTTYARLAEIKRRYDPGNLFRRNHNVPPA